MAVVLIPIYIIKESVLVLLSKSTICLCEVTKVWEEW